MVDFDLLSFAIISYEVMLLCTCPLLGSSHVMLNMVMRQIICEWRNTHAGVIRSLRCAFGFEALQGR